MQKLIDWVIEQHGEQKYGQHLYSYHLSSVVEMVKGVYGDNTYLQVLAWIHDVKEDCSVSEEDIASILSQVSFPSKWNKDNTHLDIYDIHHNILPALDAITKRKGESRKEYILRVKGNPLAKKVKIADAMCNLRECLKGGDIARARYYQNTLDLLTKDN